MRGRKREITLAIDSQGKITVKKDSDMDVILLYVDENRAEVLNPRPQLILEKREGKVTVKKAPSNTKLTVVEPQSPPVQNDAT